MYPLIIKENKLIGLEMIDLLILLSIYLVIFILSKYFLVNLALLTAAYSFLRFYKRNKPSRYTQNLVRFLILPTRYTQAWEFRR
jgi:hypothetical protein